MSLCHHSYGRNSYSIMIKFCAAQKVTRNVLDCDQSNYFSRIIFSYTFTQIGHISETVHPVQFVFGSGTQNQIRIGQDEPFQRYGHSKLYKTVDGRDLGFGPTGSSAIRSADLTPEPNMKWIG